MGYKCKNCTNYFIDGEGWELPQFNYPNCHKRPNWANLKAFPFNCTSCSDFTPRTNEDSARS